MAELLLQVERLSRRFALPSPRGAQLHAVDDVSLHIAPGESLGLVGESGCGKSTLVRLLARLLDASEGRIVFDGQDIAALPAAAFARHALRPRIQMVFQDPTDSLNPRFTARDTIAEPCRLLGGLDAAAAHARVDEVAQQVGLPPELLSRFPHQLSGGQKARVGIARALAPRPQLLILDEPTAALDVSVQAVVLQLLDRLRRELGLTTLFVSHDLNVASIILIIVYILTLIFSLKTHSYLYDVSVTDVEESGTEHKSELGKWLGILLIATIGVAFESEIFVGAVEEATKGLGLTPLFTGVILIPLVGGAAEYLTAVRVAMKDNMDLSVSVVMGSSLLVALLVAPILVLVGQVIGQPMNLSFNLFEVVSVVIAVAIANLISSDGISNWLEGVLLLATYIIIGTVFYFYPI